VDPDAAGRVSAIRSLRNRNFRLYLIGQVISQTGTWFQVTAEIWLILLITDSATAIGVHSVLRFGPLLLFGIPAGLVTDRFDHLRLLAWTQGITGIAAAILAVASFSSSPSLLLIYALVLARGIVFAIDNPLRRSFVRDLASDEELTNAISINSSANTVARSLGPAISGILIAAVGVAWCFTINALSYVPVIVTLFMIDRTKLRPAQIVGRARGQVRDGLRYAWRSRRIRRTLIMVTVLGLYPLNWNVVLPVLASDTLGGGATLYGFLTSLMAVGAFIGAAFVARLSTITGAHFRAIGALMAFSFAVIAATHLLIVAVIGLAILGAAATSFQIIANSRLQLEADDFMSGRVLAIYSVALVGTRPIGGFITGLVVDNAGPRVAFAVSAAIVAVVVVTVAFGPTSRARWSQAIRRRSPPFETPSSV
jgi:MFS family permease